MIAKLQYILILGLIWCQSCTYPPEAIDVAAVKLEVMETEIAFSAMAQRQGVPAAFLQYAADDVVMLRGKKLIQGKEAMQKYFAGQSLRDVHLSWEPSFVDVSSGGDMAYTYGQYLFSAKDTSGTMLADTGYFHTVWKKQENGEWKFVWD